MTDEEVSLLEELVANVQFAEISAEQREAASVMFDEIRKLPNDLRRAILSFDDPVLSHVLALYKRRRSHD